MLKAAAATYQAITNIAANRRYLVMLLLGFASVLPAALTAGTLQAWFTDVGINLHTIGAVTLLGLPYVLKFLWAPLFDHIKIPGFDRRRGWLFVLQVSLIILIAGMACIDPRQTFVFFHWQLPWLILLGFFTALFSASQDVVIDAYRTEILPKEEQAFGTAVYVVGYRIGLILAGAVALLLASQIGWHATYLFLASLVSVGLIATAIAPTSPNITDGAKTLTQIIIHPFQDFFQRYGFKTALIFLFLIVTYKFGDALALALNTTFLLREMGFSLAVLGLVNKTVSLVAALVGGLVAGIAMTRMSLYRALIIFGFIQAAANLGYAFMAYWGKSLFLLICTAGLENFCSGMGTIALLALIMALCNIRYTATQFAFLSAIAFIARTFVGPMAANLVDTLGWLQFFVWCFLLSLPTLIFVYLNKQTIINLKK